MRLGVGFSILSSCLFALLYFYTTLLAPMTGAQIFAWRILLALPALAVILARGRAWGQVREITGRLRRERLLWLWLPLSAGLIGVQFWLFVWAPVNQKALDVAMGYFLLPLSMALLGRIAYKERLSRTQHVAILVAALGVAHELLHTGAFSWATAIVVLGYPPYFALRRYLRAGSMGMLWFDMLLLAPVALLVLLAAGPAPGAAQRNGFGLLIAYPALILLVLLLGIISSVAVAAYISASRILPLGLFGLLGYVEPVLLFWVSVLFLGEPVSGQALLTYVPIWLAVMLIAGEAGVAWLAKKNRA